MGHRNPKNYSFDHSTDTFRITRKGKHFGCCKTRKQAERMVELFRECNWDYSMRDEIKRRSVE